MNKGTEIAGRARFDRIRYAQCWEDADVLLEAMRLREGDVCLSIASAGDNTLALAGAGAGRVIAVDMNPAQIACLELRIAAFRSLEHGEFLELAGQVASRRRPALFERCAGHLSPASRQFWERRPALIAKGFAQVGKFEGFLRAFRRVLLPLVQRRRHVERLFTLETEAERRAFYDAHWNNRRWRFFCRLFFARSSLGRFGRDPGFTRYADQTVWESLETRIPHALIELEPSRNPYLQWILNGRFGTALPWAWREENYGRIRANLDAIEWHCEPIEDVLRSLPDGTLNGCNLSDIFEYMSGSAYRSLLFQLARASAKGARLVYWNVVVKRSRPQACAGILKPLEHFARSLHKADKAFFYRDLVVEEVL